MKRILLLLVVVLLGLSACARLGTHPAAPPTVPLAAVPAAGPTRIYIEPYLQNPTPEGVTVVWWTEEPSDSNWLEYGEHFAQRVAASSEAVPSMGLTVHRAVVQGLRDRTPVPYRVRSGTAVSGEYSFRAAPGPGEGFRLGVLGDGRTDDREVLDRHRAISGLVLAHHPDLVLETGDMVATGDAVHWDRLFRQVLTASDPKEPGAPLASRIPCAFVIGNHEIYSLTPNPAEGYDHGNLDTTMARFQAFTAPPANGSADPSWEKRYYAFSFGPVHFIVLDANNTSRPDLDNNRHLPDGSTPDWEPGSEQFRWMEREIDQARERSTFTIVSMHASPFSRSEHGSPEEPQSGYRLRALDPFFRAQGVDAVITGHDHTVERVLSGGHGGPPADQTDPRNLNYFVNGNAGFNTRSALPGWQRWMTPTPELPFEPRYFYDWEGTTHTSFLEADFAPSGPGLWRVSFRTVRDDGAVFDPVTFERAAPAR